MKKFAYKNATTVADAVSILRADNSAVLAGGTDILNLLKIGVYTSPPETLVNIKNIPGLDSISEDANGLKIRATVKLVDIVDSEVVKERYPALAKAAESVEMSLSKATSFNQFCRA